MTEKGVFAVSISLMVLSSDGNGHQAQIIPLLLVDALVLVNREKIDICCLDQVKE
jgi:hypothetical protein